MIPASEIIKMETGAKNNHAEKISGLDLENTQTHTTHYSFVTHYPFLLLATKTRHPFTLTGALL
jgi:hypothetical protein